MKKVIYWLAVLFILGIPFTASVEMLLMGRYDATAVVFFVYHLVGLMIATIVSKKIFKPTKKVVKKTLEKTNNPVETKKNESKNLDPNDCVF